MITPDRTSSTPHFTNAPVTGRTVIIHATRSGKPGFPLEMQATLNHFANPYPNEPDRRASAHWVIGRDGETVRVVHDNRQAWHAQEDNDNAWGIELCQGVESDGFTEAQIGALAAVCRGYVQDFGVPPVHQLSGSASPGFIGHQETAQGKRIGKTDPGRLFPWALFLALLTPAPATATPSFRDQLDALGTVAQLVLDFEFGRDPTATLKRLTPELRATFSWLDDKLKEFS